MAVPVIERLRDLATLMPGPENASLRRYLRDAIAHIKTLDDRIAEQERHIVLLRAALIKRGQRDG